MRHLLTAFALPTQFWPSYPQRLSTASDIIVHNLRGEGAFGSVSFLFLRGMRPALFGLHRSFISRCSYVFSCLTKSSIISGFRHMENPLKIMTAIIEKIRRKRRVSSELDSRWGDMAISSPNEGSWHQYERASTKTTPVSARQTDEAQGQESKQILKAPSQPHVSANGGNLPSRKEAFMNSSITMPTGYYDAKVRRQAKRKTRSPKARHVQPNHITLTKSWEENRHGDSSADEAKDDIPALGSDRGKRGAEDANSRGSKSPPLSVTSRMRRCSGQSTTTEAIFSVSGTASSQRTSFSANDPRLARHTPQHEKKPPQGTKVGDAGPIPSAQELVPSYDDLYG